MSWTSSFVQLLGAAFISLFTLSCSAAGISAQAYEPWIRAATVTTGLMALGLELLATLYGLLKTVIGAVASRVHERRNERIIRILLTEE